MLVLVHTSSSPHLAQIRKSTSSSPPGVVAAVVGEGEGAVAGVVVGAVKGGWTWIELDVLFIFLLSFRLVALWTPFPPPCFPFTFMLPAFLWFTGLFERSVLK